MAAKKSTRATKARSAARAKPATTKKPDALARLRRPLKEVIAEARETSQELALAGLGIAAQMHKAREERMAQWIAEGKRVEPKLRKAVEDWKEAMEVEGRKFKRSFKVIDFAELRRRFAERSAA